MAVTARKREQDPVDAAREVLARAEAAHAREAERLAEARREVERLGAELRAADPDAPAFAKLAAERDAARGRVDALAEREERARLAAYRAREAQIEAERGAKQARVAELDTQLRALDAEITGEVRAFYERLIARIAEAQQLAGEAGALELALGQKPNPYGDRARGSRWAGAPRNHAVLKWAIGILPPE